MRTKRFGVALLAAAACFALWTIVVAAVLPAPGHVVSVPATFSSAEQVGRVTGAAVVRTNETEVHFAVPGSDSSVYREWLAFLADVAAEPVVPNGSATVLVRFAPDVTGADALVFEHVTGARFVRRWIGLDAWEYAVPAGVAAATFEKWLRLSPWVQWIGPNETVSLEPDAGLMGY